MTDADGRVVLYSVTSCDADFRPTFDSGGPTPVQLQERPLSETPLIEGVDPTEEDATEAIDESMRTQRRSLDYMPPSTGSTPEHYLEWTGPSSTATLGRSYFVGVNPACLSDPVRTGTHDHYSGALDEAPEGLVRVRERYAANTYAETAMPLTPVLDELGMLVLAGGGESDFACAEESALDPSGERSCSRVTVGVFWFELPSRMRDGNTRTFD